MLFLVATPIGNMSEITLRAIETLNNVDYILCEDTRTSLKLLKHYEINKTLYSYHKFNENSKIDLIVSDLKNGKNIALISDAGMPGISDPGNILVNACIRNNLDYTVISGPTAFCNAFILSGFEPPFSFIGFLPANDPEVVVYIAIDNAKGVTQYGGTIAAPVAKEIFENILPYLDK